MPSNRKETKLFLDPPSDIDTDGWGAKRRLLEQEEQYEGPWPRYDEGREVSGWSTGLEEQEGVEGLDGSEDELQRTRGLSAVGGRRRKGGVGAESGGDPSAITLFNTGEG